MSTADGRSTTALVLHPHLAAGNFCGAVLGYFGADVIKAGAEGGGGAVLQVVEQTLLHTHKCKAMRVLGAMMMMAWTPHPTLPSPAKAPSCGPAHCTHPCHSRRWRHRAALAPFDPCTPPICTL